MSTQQSSRKRKRPSEPHDTPRPAIRTRTTAACEACRVSKIRCDAVRPECTKCVKRGRACSYPDEDVSSIFEALGEKIMDAIEGQGRTLSSIANTIRDIHPQHLRSCQMQEDDRETMSRKDVAWTPITGSDKILEWAVFPTVKPVRTLPASAYVAKTNPHALETINPSATRMVELRDIFMAKIEPKFPLFDADRLDAQILEIAETGFGRCATSCMVLLVFANAAIWGNYPEDERRLVSIDDTPEYYTLAVPEQRLTEASIYFAMAQRRMAAVSLEDSMLGVLCYCLFGTYFQYSFEPIQAWKMFRMASTQWEAQHLQHAHSESQRSKEEESFEAQLYWLCMKAEYEIRHEIPDLPPCTLQDSDFPFSLPSFPMSNGIQSGTEDPLQRSQSIVPSAPSSHYFFLAEISLRRLLNRARHAATLLSPNIDSPTAEQVAETIDQLEDQLQRWLECLPPTLCFTLPPDSPPPQDEPELVKLMRERYVEVRELLCRVFLYICLHAGPRLTSAQAKAYGARASDGLRLSVYRIRTERPFFRHAGSWIACRVRFNQALCLVAAARGAERGLEAASYVVVPPGWRECVIEVRNRLETWSDQGAGIGELVVLLDWLIGDGVQ